MKKRNSIIKFFIPVVMVLTMLLVTIPAFSADNFSILSKIEVSRPNDSSIALNLYFNNQFKNNAFLQKRTNGSYYVFLPDTALKNKKIKISYADRKLKPSVKIQTDQNLYMKNKSKSAYVKLNVKMDNDYKIKLISKTEKPSFFVDFFKFIGKALLFLLFLFIGGAILWTKSFNNRSNRTYSSTYVKPGFFVSNEPEQEISYPEYKKVKSAGSMDNSLNYLYNKKSPDRIKAESEDFSCFDIPLAQPPEPADEENNVFAFKNTLTQASMRLKQKPDKLRTVRRQTNPIKKNLFETVTELSMPAQKMFLRKKKQISPNYYLF